MARATLVPGSESSVCTEMRTKDKMLAGVVIPEVGSMQEAGKASELTSLGSLKFENRQL
jgi:hypothetical protein